MIGVAVANAALDALPYFPRLIVAFALIVADLLYPELLVGAMAGVIVYRRLKGD